MCSQGFNYWGSGRLTIWQPVNYAVRAHGSSGQLLAAPVSSWQLLAAPGSSWQFLAAPGNSWQLLQFLAAPGSSWQRLGLLLSAWVHMPCDAVATASTHDASWVLMMHHEYSCCDGVGGGAFGSGDDGTSCLMQRTRVVFAHKINATNKLSWCWRVGKLSKELMSCLAIAFNFCFN